jgi:pyruvate dehydrogenase E1 component alpha subunit
LRRSGQVSVAFFGEGASSEGAFHESLNLAAVWSLPVVFVCENNGWSEWMRMDRVTARGAVVQHAAAYGFAGVTVDGNDACAVYAAASEAVSRARAGDGPTLIEAITYRLSGHGTGDEAYIGKYRADDELAQWRARDPIAKLRSELIAGGLSAETVDALDHAAESEVDAAVEFARSSPPPPLEWAFTDMWVEVDEGGDTPGRSR